MNISFSPLRQPHPRKRARQAGNAVIYVLLAIALFAALTFVLARHSGTSETSTMSKNQVDIDATQILQTAMQVKQAVDSMVYSGSRIGCTTDHPSPCGELDFTLPSDAGYDTPPNDQKVFHPDGGGVILPPLPETAVIAGTDPAPGWYLDRFNNVAWTPTTDTDVVMTAYHINEAVCAKIDEKLLGSGVSIPVSTVPLRTVLVSATRHSGGNIDFSSSDCSGCDGQPAMCVEDSDHASWSFYSLVETR